MRIRGAAVAALVIGLCLVACAEGSLGESCEKEGAGNGECDEGLVCGKRTDTSSELVCLKQCSQRFECGSNEDCRALANTSLKGCRPQS